MGIIILLLVIKRLYNKWASQFSTVRDTYGLASMEEVEEVREQGPAPVLRHPSCSSIRTNPYPKRLAAIKDERVQEQLNFHQAQKLMTGVQEQLDLQQAQKLLPTPPLGYTMTCTLRHAGAPVKKRNARNIVKEVDVSNVSVI